MTIIAKIVAFLYMIGSLFIIAAGFLYSLIAGCIVCGVLLFIPCIILYLEASKGGGYS